MASPEEQAFRTSSPVDQIREVASATLDDRKVNVYNLLDELPKRRPGWDGYDGKVPSPEAVDQAKAFVANLSSEILMPAIEPSGEGDVNLVWRSEVAYLEIGFDGSSEFSFFGKTKTDKSQRSFGDVPIAANRLPLQLLWLMGQFQYELRVRKHIAEQPSLAWAS